MLARKIKYIKYDYYESFVSSLALLLKVSRYPPIRAHLFNSFAGNCRYTGILSSWLNGAFLAINPNMDQGLPKT